MFEDYALPSGEKVVPPEPSDVEFVVNLLLGEVPLTWQRLLSAAELLYKIRVELDLGKFSAALRFIQALATGVKLGSLPLNQIEADVLVTEIDRLVLVGEANPTAQNKAVARLMLEAKSCPCGIIDLERFQCELRAATGLPPCYNTTEGR